MGTFFDLYRSRPDVLTHKWHNYFWVYEKHLEKFIGQKPRMLEIGVQRGGSATLFKEWFGEGAVIVGVDVDPACRDLSLPQGISIEIGDQEDADFLKKLIDRYGPFDIVLDDGGHTFSQIKTSFDHLFDSVKDDGVYIIEDTCCQFWDGSHYQGPRGPKDFRDFLWELHTSMNRDMGSQELFAHWHTAPDERESTLHDLSSRRMIKAISLYESMLVIDRGARPIPYSELR